MTRREFIGRQRGFTLLETALTIVIVGTGIMSMLRLFAACTSQNSSAAKMTTAMLLVSHIQELTSNLPFDDPFTGSSHFGPEAGETLATFNDVDDFDGSSFTPPIDSTRQPILEQAQYTQVVSVVPILTTQLNSNTIDSAPTISKGTYTGAVRIRVKILYRRYPGDAPSEVYRASWVRLDR